MGGGGEEGKGVLMNDTSDECLLEDNRCPPLRRKTDAAERVADIGHMLPPPRVCGKFNEENARGRRGGEEGGRGREETQRKTTVTDGGVE